MSGKTYQYILLDWDGNLAKTLDLWLDAFRTVLSNRGFDLADTEIAALFGDAVGLFRDLGVKDPETALHEADALVKHTLPNVELYPEALELLHSLRNKGKQTALITSSVRANVQHLLEHYQIDQLFDVVVCGDDITHHKPHPEMVEVALAKLGGQKDTAVIIGDSDKDMGVAQNAGIDAILFYPPEHAKYHDIDKLKTFNPVYIVADLRDVPALLN